MDVEVEKQVLKKMSEKKSNCPKISERIKRATLCSKLAGHYNL